MQFERRAWIPGAATATFLCLVVAALSLGGDARAAARKTTKQTAVVEAANGPLPLTWQWSPGEITIATSDSIRFENPTTETHSVVAWDGTWEVRDDLAAGGSLTTRFKEPGVYSYRCSVFSHSDLLYLGTERRCVGMCGVITVE